MAVARDSKICVPFLRHSRRMITKEVFRRYEIAKSLEHANASGVYEDDIYTFRSVYSTPIYINAIPNNAVYAQKIVQWEKSLEKGKPESKIFRYPGVGIAEGAVPTVPRNGRERIIYPNTDKKHEALIFCYAMESWLAQMPQLEQAISVLFYYHGHTLKKTLEYLKYEMNIHEFNDKERKSLTIDTLKKRIYRIMPYETSRKSVIDWWSEFALKREIWK